MNITKTQLISIIKEELANVISEKTYGQRSKAASLAATGGRPHGYGSEYYDDQKKAMNLARSTPGAKAQSRLTPYSEYSPEMMADEFYQALAGPGTDEDGIERLIDSIENDSPNPSEAKQRAVDIDNAYLDARIRQGNKGSLSSWLIDDGMQNAQTRWREIMTSGMSQRNENW